MKTKERQIPEVAYLNYYRRAMAAIQAIQNKIHDLPAPDGEIAINWAHVGDIGKIATDLEEVAQ